jgi:hypothetical protein
MNATQVRGIEQLYDRQITDLTRRTVRGNNPQMRLRQIYLDEFGPGFGTLQLKAYKKFIRRPSSEDYECDEELEEFKDAGSSIQR